MTINKYGIRVIDEAEQLEGYETFEGSDDIRGNFVRVSTGGLIDGFSTIVEIKDDEFFGTVHSIFSSDEHKDEVYNAIQNETDMEITGISGDCYVHITNGEVRADS